MKRTSMTLVVSSLCAAMSLGSVVGGYGQPTAKEWNAGVKAGWNLGNQFECPPYGFDNESFALDDPEGADRAETAWGNPAVTRKTIEAVKRAGFDAIRIPIRWQCHITNSAAMSISKTWMARIKEVVGYCLDCDMKVIINVHHEKWLESRPTYACREENCRRLALLWNNIASEFRDYDYRLAFAGTNEVHEKDNWGAPTEENLAVQNAYNQMFVEVVRATGGNNAKRHLIVQTYVCNPDFGLHDGDFIVPQDAGDNANDYLSVEFHFYNPWDYCGECRYYYWGAPFRQYGETSPSDEKTLADFFDRVSAAWSDRGLGIVIGEWGVTDHYKSGEADRAHENATYYCKTFIAKARKRGFSTFIWDNNAFGNGREQFGIFDRHRGMKVRSPWILEGVTGYQAVSATRNTKKPKKQ